MKASDLILAMSNAGAPIEAILIAVRAIEERDDALAAKRAVERDRKRRQRANERDTDGTVTGQSRDTDGTVTDNPSPAPLSSPQTPHHTPHPHPDNNTRARKGSVLACPSDVSPQTWADFLAHRKRIKADATETAVNRIRKQAEAAGWSMDDALAELVARGWRGFSSDWVSSAAKPAPKPSGSPVDPVAQAEKTAALYRRMGRDDDAAEVEQRAARLRLGGGMKPIGSVLGGLIAPP